MISSASSSRLTNLPQPKFSSSFISSFSVSPKRLLLLSPFQNKASASAGYLSITNVLKTADSLNLSSTAADLDSVFANSKPTILVSEKLGDAGLDLLRSFAIVDCCYNLSPEELCSKISMCDALIVRSGTKVNRKVFEASKGRLKVVGRAGVGIDNVDLQAATEFGCLVVNAPTANTIAAAEHGIALLASMSRNVSQSDASIKAGMFFFSFFLLLILY